MRENGKCALVLSVDNDSEIRLEDGRDRRSDARTSSADGGQSGDAFELRRDLSAWSISKNTAGRLTGIEYFLDICASKSVDCWSTSSRTDTSNPAADLASTLPRSSRVTSVKLPASTAPTFQ